MDYNTVDYIVSASLALIMFGIGLSLTFRQFKSVFLAPKSIIVGLIAQMIALPLIAFLIVSLTDLPPEFKVGIIILSACPGGTTSNLITYLLDGRTVLSVSLTSINSIITLVSIPFIVNIALKAYMGVETEFRLPYMNTIAQIFAITIIPAVLGIVVNMKFPKFAARLNAPVILPYGLFPKLKFNVIKPLVTLLLAVVFSIKLFADKEYGGASLETEDIIQLLPVGLAFNISSLLFGYFLALALGFRRKIPMTIGIEVGLQNTALAFLVAGTLLQNSNMEKPALVYAFFSFFTTVAFGIIAKYFDTKYRKRPGSIN